VSGAVGQRPALSPSPAAAPGKCWWTWTAEREYYARRIDLDDRNQLVSFGTSGHELTGCAALSPRARSGMPKRLDYRKAEGHRAAVLGRTHTPYPGWRSGRPRSPGRQRVETVVQTRRRVTPTPVIVAILMTIASEGSRGRIVITPSHNPPRWGLKYNPRNGGPRYDVTRWIQDRANSCCGWQRRVKAHAVEKAIQPEHARRGPGHALLRDLVALWIWKRSVRLVSSCSDPLGVRRALLGAINSTWGLDITVVNPAIDPTSRS